MWFQGLVVLLLLTGTQAQSGDSDSEPRLVCVSDIMITNCTLSCRLEGHGVNMEDDEDHEADGIQNMTMCFHHWSSLEPKCFSGLGDSVSSPDLNPMGVYTVTAHLRGGGRVSASMELKKIVKPRRPKVASVTYDPNTDQMVFLVQTPYHREILKVENQVFQLIIWTSGGTGEPPQIQNISCSNSLKISMQHLTRGAKYQVRVRSIPATHLEGSWSEWSQEFRFRTPEGDLGLEGNRGVLSPAQTLRLAAGLVSVLLLAACVVLFWKARILSYMWPNIPQPKDTLVQICRTNKGLLLNFKPEEFSALKVYPPEKPVEPPPEEALPLPPLAPPIDSPQSTPPSSTQTSHCSTATTSISAEELFALLSSSDGEDGGHSGGPPRPPTTSISAEALFALLSSSDGEDGGHSGGPPPIEEWRPRTPPPADGKGAESGGGQQEEAYVTMSSFYQIR